MKQTLRLIVTTVTDYEKDDEKINNKNLIQLVPVL